MFFCIFLNLQGINFFQHPKIGFHHLSKLCYCLTHMNIFSRTKQLVGQPALDKLRLSSVAVFGLGGVGSFTTEALARAGVGRFLLVDDDLICITNLNRQLIALHSTLGRAKTEVMAERVRDINPAIQIEARQTRYSSETAETFDLSAYDYIVDAIDTVSAKVELAVRAAQTATSIISCMGAGNKLDPTRFEVADISTTSVCPLCKIMRKSLKQRGISTLKVVYSREPPVKSTSAPCRTPGSISFVPSVAGLIIAGEVVRALIASANCSPTP